jgi:hypothetical protein
MSPSTQSDARVRIELKGQRVEPAPRRRILVTTWQCFRDLCLLCTRSIISPKLTNDR